jgi:hypothetical protein
MKILSFFKKKKNYYNKKFNLISLLKIYKFSKKNTLIINSIEPFFIINIKNIKFIEINLLLFIFLNYFIFKNNRFFFFLKD